MKRVTTDDFPCMKIDDEMMAARYLYRISEAPRERYWHSPHPKTERALRACAIAFIYWSAISYLMPSPLYYSANDRIIAPSTWCFSRSDDGVWYYNDVIFSLHLRWTGISLSWRYTYSRVVRCTLFRRMIMKPLQMLSREASAWCASPSRQHTLAASASKIVDFGNHIIFIALLEMPGRVRYRRAAKSHSGAVYQGRHSA